MPNYDTSNLTGSGFTTENDDDKLVVRLIRITAAQVVAPSVEMLADTINLFRAPSGALYHSDGASLVATGSTAGSASHLGEVASEAAMIALPATKGNRVDRTDVGTGGTTFELTTDDPTVAANWQALAEFIDDNSVHTLTLVPGARDRVLLVFVAAATTVDVVVGAVTYPLGPSLTAHAISTEKLPGVAAATSITVQRTSGSADTGWYSLKDL